MSPDLLQKQVANTIKELTKVISSGKWGDGSKMTRLQRDKAYRVIKFLQDPNAKAGAISKIIATIGTAAGGLALNVGEAIAGIVVPKEQTKQLQAQYAKEQAIETALSNERVQKAAIDAGLWNSGLAGQPVNSGNQQEGQTGQKGGNQSTGSFLGG